MNEDQARFMNDILTRVANEVGKEVDMTGEQLLAHLLMGDRRHPEAPADECGAISPRDPMEQTWCRAEVDHPGDHKPWKPYKSWKGVQ
jgi:hypothetical protein